MSRRYRKAGYGSIVAPGHVVVEFDTQTCGHCNHVYVVRSSDPHQPVDLGGGCRVCGHVVCGSCADLGGCTPFLRRVEVAEQRHALARACGLVT
jgi:hypothetical protein